MSASRYPVLWGFVLAALTISFLTPYLPVAWHGDGIFGVRCT